MHECARRAVLKGLASGASSLGTTSWLKLSSKNQNVDLSIPGSRTAATVIRKSMVGFAPPLEGA